MYQGKKILLTAFSPEPGSESQAIYDYLKTHGADDITAIYWGGPSVKEKIPDDIKLKEVANRNAIDGVDMSGFDLIFRHQTVRPDWLPDDTPVTTATIEFFKHCPADIIGVTGTKGKGTTSTLISHMLEAAGKTAHLVGNIGVPVLGELSRIKEDDLVVFEISSFQLWDLNDSPHVAVLLMIASDHLDVHANLDEYVAAKANITAHQSADDILIHHPTNKMTQKAIAGSKAKRLAYMSEQGAHLDGDTIVIDNKAVVKRSEIALRGTHNLENICAAITAVWQYTQDIEAIAKVCREFEGLEHRFEPAGEKQGVQYFNDSFSASLPAAIAAVNAFEEPKIMIFGGSDKGARYQSLAEALKQSNVKTALLIGDTGPSIARTFEKYGVENFELLEDEEITMQDIVNRAAELADKGDVVILSPGCASFDMFKNYKDRGNQFKKAVKALDG